MSRLHFCLSSLLVLAFSLDAKGDEDSFPPLKGKEPPQNFEELWAGYDPSREPLEVQVVHEWKNEGITTRMLTYSVGTFKGTCSQMGAYYSFPDGASGKVPGILQMHGGGQRASREMAEAAAGNGYACISINWGGKAMADQKAHDPGTDWGALDATQTGHNSHYSSLQPDAKTLDSVVSPRNNNWFLIVVSARRALTFLQQQPEVDRDRLGVRGHSMGGKLTVMVAGADSRVKAAFPSCGGTAPAPEKIRNCPGSSTRPINKELLYHTTISDLVAIKRITCPILYAGPHNDFNGNLDNLYENWKEMPGKDIHFTISPHLNHRHLKESLFAGPHFFDVHLKGQGHFPATPDLEVRIKTENGIPLAMLKPDRPDEVVKVDFYYSVDPHALTRFWRTAPSTKSGNIWTAECAVTSVDMPLFVMANVHYPLESKIIGTPWAREAPGNFIVSSWGLTFEAIELQTAGLKATDTVDRVIEAEFDDRNETWQDWYQLERYNHHHRTAITRKIKDPKFRGPDGAHLAIEVRDPEGGELAVTFTLNGWNTYSGVKKGEYYATKPIAKSGDWQTIAFLLRDLVPMDQKTPKGINSWRYMTELGIKAHVRVRQPDGSSKTVGGSPWNKTRQLRNLRWVGGEYPSSFLLPGRALSDEEFQKIFHDEIDKSVEQEKRDTEETEDTK